MKPIPEIVREYVMRTCGRMPETDKEIDQYLDLINNAKEYERIFLLEQKFSKSFLKNLGFKSSEQIKKEGEKIFQP